MRAKILLWLLPFWLLNQWGFFWLTEAAHEYARLESKSKLENSDGQGFWLTFSKNQLTEIEWQEAGREFVWQGRWYDIGQWKALPDGGAKAYVVYDEHDTRLSSIKNRLSGWWADLGQSPEKKQAVAEWLIKYAWWGSVSVLTTIFAFEILTIFFSYCNLYDFLLLVKHSPPPKMAVFFDGESCKC
jgi:hypothetical protein